MSKPRLCVEETLGKSPLMNKIRVPSPFSEICYLNEFWKVVPQGTQAHNECSERILFAQQNHRRDAKQKTYYVVFLILIQDRWKMDP